MRRTNGLIQDFQCPNWDISTRRNSAADFLALVINELGDLRQAIAVDTAADHKPDAVFGPEQRRVLTLRGVAHLRRSRRRLGGVDREALAGGALIHQERGGTGGSGQTPS